MIALDTNVLVYARREETRYHDEAKRLVSSLAEGDEPWAIAWPCVYEFVRVVTHPRVFSPPTPVTTVLDDLQSLLKSPSLTVLGEGPAHLLQMDRTIRNSRATGNLVHDAHIAALLIEHGVAEVLTADRDFTRFHGLRVRDPFTL